MADDQAPALPGTMSSALRPRHIVLTGGPCAGKTTSLAHLRERLAERGVRVFLAPEIATQFIVGGVHDLDTLATTDRERYLGVQRQILAAQRAARERYTALASLFVDQPSVVLYDRAELDVAAYVSAAEVAALCASLDLDIIATANAYDAVLHLTTAADGAMPSYTRANNAARSESPEQAIALDRRTLAAWMGHPYLRVIGNTGGFSAKLDRVVAHVSAVLGIPVPVEIERKYLLVKPPSTAVLAAVGAHRVTIEQIYLVAPVGEELRIRKRLDAGSATCYRTHKSGTGIARLEHEEVITSAQYDELSRLADPTREPIRKDRHCFVWRDQFFELDVFTGRLAGLTLLEIELLSETDAVELPPFLAVEREVTVEAAYKNAQLAVARAG